MKTILLVLSVIALAGCGGGMHMTVPTVSQPSVGFHPVGSARPAHR